MQLLFSPQYGVRSGFILSRLFEQESANRV